MRKLLLTAAAIIAATAAEASEKPLADGTTEVVERKIETKVSVAKRPAPEDKDPENKPTAIIANVPAKTRSLERSGLAFDPNCFLKKV